MIANLARLSDDMHKAKSAVERSMRGIEGAVASAKAALGALGVGVGFGAIVAGFRSVVDAAAKLDDVAEKTGAAVAELSKLEQVARIGGHSMETAEGALIRLSRSLHEDDEAAKKATKALSALGLKAEDLRNLDTAQALHVVAVEMNKYGDGSGKTALALDLLGKSGAQVLPLLKDLATEGGINARVTAEQAAEAEEFQKNLGRLKNEIYGVTQALALGAVPAMNDWITANREAIRIAGSASEALRLFVFNLDAMTSEAPRQEIERLTEALRKFQAAGSIGRFMQSPTGVIFGGREEDLTKQIAFLKYLERQQALEGRTGPQFMDARDLRQLQKPVIDYSGSGKTGTAGQIADLDSTYRGLLKSLKEKLLLDRELTEVAKLQLALDALGAKQRATITSQREAELKVLAAQVDANKLAAEAMENNAKNEEALAKMRQEGAEAMAEFDRKRGDALIAGYEHARQIEFETQLIGLSNEAREQAIALRSLETSGIRETDAAYAALAERLKKAIAEKTLAEENKKAADEVSEAWRTAAKDMQREMSSTFFDFMQGKIGNLGDRFKQMLDKMVADALAAQLANAMFGERFMSGKSRGSSPGGWLGQGLDWLMGAIGGGGGGWASMGGGIDPSGLGGAANGANFMVGGVGGTDSQVVAFRASPNERVRVETPAQQRGSAVPAVTIVQQFAPGTDRRTVAHAAAEAGDVMQRVMRRDR